ncbi:MAG: glycogen debranching N-terminal domain-containing protein [Microbacterium sp.]|uniref:glycogen debranching N-terminal domain-containing protein n=1 Tax=Microbacterium sp. TaxID=51671 RepID=UPI002727C851|nr:glycogen debranching N-terminal domain-containing protein [Microbacterium sp.]MDO8381608.1 glycogen debranching N-terminal domain-containing protein [Microbacterium sp.]
MTEATLSPSPEHRQPFISDSVVILRAPTQVWSGRDGDVRAGDRDRAIDGFFHGDVRYLREASLTYDGRMPEWISSSPVGASRAVFDGVMRAVDDPTPDPKVRILRDRTVTAGGVRETISLRSKLEYDVSTVLRVRLVPEFAPLQEVKAGQPEQRAWVTAPSPDAAGGARVSSDVSVSSNEQSLTLSAPAASRQISEDAVTLTWDVRIPAGARVDVAWSILMEDPSLVVQGPAASLTWRDLPSFDSPSPLAGDPRVQRWLERALADLEALRLVLRENPEDEFYAAGAPWFFTLFGRDSLWAARLALPVDAKIAASTLRVLGRMQGERADPDTAEQPGKILHELRSTPLEMPSEGIVLPPVYFGTVDATALWICLLADAWSWGMPDDEVRDLVPTLRAALDWLVHHGDSDGDGFIDYIDESGHGLTNQGWKDSGDSIQWRTGQLAEGPIALCEVQGYAYEAALAGASILERLGEPGAPDLRVWAAALKARFAEYFWVQTPEGRYPAVALDARKRPVDTLTSNIGHLLGTGILDPADEVAVADLLLGPSMLSGFGVRTMSTDAAGYWPLSYHGGSVWAHDTAIIAHGMLRAGLADAATTVVAGLLDAAEAFQFRMPELHGGDSRSDLSSPSPYPAACRPQAWSAAAAVVAAQVARGIAFPVRAAGA